MNTKLTLSINAQIIKKAKKYASSHNKSVSQIVSTYLDNLSVPSSNFQQITPWARELIGSQSVDMSDKDLKEEYLAHINKKYS